MPDKFPVGGDISREPTTAPVRPNLRRHGTEGALAGVVITAAVIAALYFGQDMLIPLTLAAMLSFLLSPLMDLLRRLWLGRVAAALVAVLLGIVVIMGLGSVIGTGIAELVSQVPKYRTTIDTKVNSLRELASSELNGLGRIVDKVENLGAAAPAPASPTTPHSSAKHSEPASTTAGHSSPSSMLALGRHIITPLVSPIVTFGVILLVTIFILLQKHDVRDRVIRLFAPQDFNRATAAFDDAGRLLSHYFLGKLAVNCIFGVVVGIGLLIIGVPDPALWGILGLLLRFVPYFGSYIAAIPPFLLAAAVGHGWIMALWTAVLFVGTELVLGNAVEPTLFGRTTGLSPLAVIIAAIFWALLWGLIGLILSTPLTLCLVVLGRHVPELAFLDILLGDRPALTRAETFYQRVLAGDPDEAAGLAECFLEEHALPEYYDDVALPALQFATADAAKGLIASLGIERIKRTVGAVIQELDKRQDALLPVRKKAGLWRRLFGEVLPDEGAVRRARLEGSTATGSDPRRSSVLCVAGRGQFDEVVAAMLVQILVKRGIGARIVPHDATSRESIASLDVTDARIACVLYLDIAGIPAHLHFVVRRLKERLPNALVVIGLLARQDASFKNDRAKKALGADSYVTSLRDALALCLSYVGRSRAETEHDQPSRKAAARRAKGSS